MSDYINREDAKDAVINIVGRKKIAMYVDEMSNHPSTKDIDYYDALMDAEDAIDDLPSADVAPKWIPCEERLPEPNVAVLGYAPKFDNIFAVYYDSVCGWMTWSPVYDEPFPSYQGEIVAWMPLPEPYEGERKDDDTD